MRINELTESFNSARPIKWVSRSSERWFGTTEQRFQGNHIFKIQFKKTHDTEWEVDFDVGFYIDVTHEGDAYAIFSTVLGAIKEFLETVKPKYLTFTSNKSESASRSKLYKRMIEKFAGTVGYTSEVADNSSPTGAWKEDIFLLKRIEQV